MRKILAGLFVLLALNASAIEGLRISVVQSNVVLGWPSQTNESFIVQWRSSFDTNHPWLTLTTNHLAATGTNWTVFTHTNTVVYPEPCPGSTNGGSSEIPGPSFQRASGGASAESSLPPVPWDESTWSTPTFSKRGVTLNDLEPMDEEPECTNATFTAGFYRVVATGLKVVREPDYLGDASLPAFQIEAGLIGTWNAPISLLLNDLAVPGLKSISYPLTNTFVFVDSTKHTNGVYAVSATTSLTQETSPTGDPNGNFRDDIHSPAIALTVSNAISFPYWEPHIDSIDRDVWVQARSASLSNTFLVHYFGDNDTYIGTTGGQTQNGAILAYWNSVLPSGQPYAGNSVRVVVETRTPTASGTVTNFATSPTSRYALELNFPSFGEWMVVRQASFESMLGGQELVDAVDAFAIGVINAANQTPDVNATLHPPSWLVGASYSGAYRIATTPDAAVSNSWYITQASLDIDAVRNLLYLGHASKLGLGGYEPPKLGDGKFFGLTWADIGRALNNGRWYSSTNGPSQRYRFAMIYGCSSADSELPEALGLAPKTRDEKAGDYSVYGGPRPRAFVGFDSRIKAATRIGGVGNYSIEGYHEVFVKRFLTRWTSGLPLNAAISAAITSPTNLFAFPQSSLKTIGYDQLKFQEANSQ